MSDSPARRVLQVSEITGAIKTILEEGFPDLTVEGEISNFRPASSGHLYFTLKDRTAMIQCVFFRGAAGSLSFQPRDGNRVRVRASLSVYPPRGAYQLILRSMHPVGEGDILAMLEERKARLHREGLFDRALPLPWFPATVAIITSPTGAAVRDILHVLRRRGAGVDVRILPVPVQGPESAPAIARMIAHADRHRLGEVIVVTRGGGSLEDLLPFSEEEVLRAIGATTIPVISAVGHETDTALSDYAADYRAPTPSAAAEVLSAAEEEVHRRLSHAAGNIHREFRQRLELIGRRLERVSREELQYRFRNFAQPWYQRVDAAVEEVRSALRDRLTATARRLEVATERVESSSPLAALQRGYAILRDRQTGKIVTRAAQTVAGQDLEARMADGTIPLLRVERTMHEEL